MQHWSGMPLSRLEEMLDQIIEGSKTTLQAPYSHSSNHPLQHLTHRVPYLLNSQ